MGYNRQKNMSINIKNIIETDDQITVVAEDDYNGQVYTETVSHNRSSWDRNNAKDEAIRRALNH